MINFTAIIIQGQQSTHFNQESIEFPITLEHGKYSRKMIAVLDTGSEDMLIPQGIARKLHLTNLSEFTVTTTTGSKPAYYSNVSFKLNNSYFKNYSCEVSGNLPVVLFGVKFFRENHLNLTIDFLNNTFEIWRDNVANQIY